MCGTMTGVESGKLNAAGQKVESMEQEQDHCFRTRQQGMVSGSWDRCTMKAADACRVSLGTILEEN